MYNLYNLLRIILFSQPDVALIGGHSNILQTSETFANDRGGQIGTASWENRSSTAFPFKYELLWSPPQISGSVNTLSAVHMTKQ